MSPIEFLDVDHESVTSDDTLDAAEYGIRSH